MNTFLIIGNGAREHAIIKSILINKNIVHCIGNKINPGIFKLIEENMVAHDIMDFEFIQKYVIENKIDYLFVGPEKPLAAGIINNISLVCDCIGPTKEQAQIESSKFFTRKLLNDNDLGIYNPDYILVNHCNDLKKCSEFVLKHEKKVVLKIDGLEGGKGVSVYGVHFRLIEEMTNLINKLLYQNKPFLVEEKLEGVEFSLLTFTDGTSFIHGNPIMDFKLLYNDNTGPNTGSMGSISDNDLLNFLDLNELKEAQSVNEKVINILNDMYSMPYKGVLYGSFMKTKLGIKVIEFNCRLGDPEGVLVLNQLSNCFGDIIKWISNGTINKYQSSIKFKNKKMMCKYLVSSTYPKPSKESFIFNIPRCIDKCNDIFYGSAMFLDESNKINMSCSSRGILILKEGIDFDDIEKKINLDFNKICSINKNDFHFRTDLTKQYYNSSIIKSAYLKSGVDIDKVTKTLNDNKKLIKSTHNEYVLSDLSSFGGMFSLDCITKLKIKEPILVSSTDGVGTKTDFVEKYYGVEGFEILGQDIVNHCVNDILVQGAIPLYFLDYFASSKFNEDKFNYFIKGVTKACKENNCVLIGGETAEMPGVYNKNKCDIVGTITGIVDKVNIINGNSIKENDIVIALPSASLHTNGFSLVREIYKDCNLNIGLNPEFVKQLTYPHRSYLNEITELLKNKIEIKGLCHITGGGLIDNPVRIIPKNLKIVYENLESKIPPIYKILQKDGRIELEELMRVFNCGIGMMIIIPKSDEPKVLELLNDAYYLGHIETNII